MTIIIIILQIFCIILVTAGMIIEFFYEAHMGFIFITAGSLIFAAVTKLFELQLLKENRMFKQKTKE